ncbi:DUF3164 family protein [Phenylobacterium sp.]|uniref:DUF3164 family protein n=1 Tax=Phenylobacterium sp. TaxID=1871053 RepID=UPI00198F25A8|nr:DUF3164 family protein [Phenylobacterium sp.]MBC7168704.1 DUF3164 family protein [Phenylobacterium sp.]
MTTETPTARYPDAIVKMPDGEYMRDAKGALMPIKLIREQDLLEDQLVRRMIGFAHDLSEEISRFKAHCNADVGTFLQLIEEKYGAKKGGAKGNVTFTSYDGCLKVQVQVAERITFGAGLQVAKALIDECIAEWSGGARPELKALVNEAFRADSEGQVSREAVFRLMRMDITDPRWTKAMEALKDSIRTVGSKSYVRFYRREDPEAKWEAVTVDMAAA